MLGKIAWILLIIGGLNWGIYGVAGIDLVEIVFGFQPMLARIIYVLVGLSAIVVIFHKKTCNCGCEHTSEPKI